MKNKIQITVTRGFIQNKEGKFLIVKRALTDSYPGRWELPGGSSDHGEHPHEAVKREVSEEVGLTVDPLHPLITTSYYSPRKPHVHYILIYYLCKLTDESTEVTLSDEHMDCAWVTFDKLKDFELTEFMDGIHNLAHHPLIQSA